MNDLPMRTMGLVEAAKMLRMHKETLKAKKEIPRGKAGRELVFIEADLIAYIRSQYGAPCPSINKPGRRPGTSTSPTLASLGYVGLLERRIETRRKKSTTS